jgi:superfamily II DNA or RNA helicase
MTLRNYQTEHIDEALTDFKTLRSIMLQMPTGTGKTHVFCDIAKNFCKTEKKRVLILAHRNELIFQIKERLERFGFHAGIIKSGHIIDDTRQIQIASVQTLIRKNKIIFLSNISLIIVDEAHHTPSKTYIEILKVYQKEQTKLLGVTATPIRLDGKGFDKIFDKLICSYSLKWFIINKYLSPIKHYASDIIKLENISVVKNREGYKDYDEKQTEKYYLNKTVMADIIDSYKKFGENKKSVVFAVTINHAEEIEKRFKEAGYNATVISSLTSPAERKYKVEKFKAGEITILVNVDIFSEGFDCPDIEVVQIVKPTKSLVKYLQMVGRVMRTFKNKKYGIILDNSCLWQDHGLVTDEREWILNGCITKKHDFENLFFSDGSSGSDAYKRKLKELFNIDMIEVDRVGFNSEIIFTDQRLISLRTKCKITWKQLTHYLRDEGIDINEHLKGKSTDPDKRYVSKQLHDIIKRKLCTNNELSSAAT